MAANVCAAYRHRAAANVWVDRILRGSDLVRGDADAVTRVDWAADLLYLDVPSARNPFDLLINRDGAHPAWLSRVQRLAVSVNRNYRPAGNYVRRARALPELRELVFVIGRQPGPPGDPITGLAFAVWYMELVNAWHKSMWRVHRRELLIRFVLWEKGGILRYGLGW
ncbi:hypothetical protein F4810DRAFT_695531 [Camillea tinctor]|nr:hypothetical protein F4810DRAFT_695531 [Camillea tinctor]